jgi:hypothetical protein
MGRKTSILATGGNRHPSPAADVAELADTLDSQFGQTPFHRVPASCVDLYLSAVFTIKIDFSSCESQKASGLRN